MKTNSHSSLLFIYLNWNNLSANCNIYLADSIKSNTTLFELIIWNNKISDFEVRCLSQAIKLNSTLITNDLINNDISD